MTPELRTASRAPRPLPDVVEEHLDEFEFSWGWRQSILFEDDWTLADLAQLEERAEAHLDALRLSMPHALPQVRQRLAGERTFEVFAGARAALASAVPEAVAELLVMLETARGERLDGLRLALRLDDLEAIEPELRGRLETADSELELALVDVLSFRRRSAPPLSGRPLPARAEALAWRVRARTGDLAGDAWRAATLHQDSSVRGAALEAGARARIPELLAICRAAARRASEADAEAIELLGLLGEREDVRRLVELSSGAGPIAARAIAGLGRSGRPESVEPLIEALARDDLAAEATRAFTRITGTRGPLERGDPPGEAPLVQASARRHWQRRSAELAKSPRWSFGIEVAASGLPTRFEELPLFARHDLHLRAAAAGACPDFEPEQLAGFQLAPARPPRSAHG